MIELGDTVGSVGDTTEDGDLVGSRMGIGEEVNGSGSGVGSKSEIGVESII